MPLLSRNICMSLYVGWTEVRVVDTWQEQYLYLLHLDLEEGQLVVFTWWLHCIVSFYNKAVVLEQLSRLCSNNDWVLGISVFSRGNWGYDSEFSKSISVHRSPVNWFAVSSLWQIEFCWLVCCFILNRIQNRTTILSSSYISPTFLKRLCRKSRVHVLSSLFLSLLWYCVALISHPSFKNLYHKIIHVHDNILFWSCSILKVFWFVFFSS